MLGALAASVVCLLGYALHPPRLRRRRSLPHPRRRGNPATADDWARWLHTVAAGVRSGDSVRVAVQHAHAHHALDGSVVHPGAPLDQLLQGTPTDADEAVVIQVLAVATALGGAVAATLQAGAALLHERAAVRAEALAHAAQARLSARVLTAVPLVFAAWNLIGSASFRRALGTPVGATAAAAGALLSVAGWRWMRRIVRKATP